MNNFALTVTLMFAIFSSIFNISFAQIPSNPGLKIVIPEANSTVPIGELTITGISTDNATTDCQVSVDLNDISPYQNVTATGPEGQGDYSNWTFTFTTDYQLIGNGANEITSKMFCSDGINNATKYFSRNVTGIANGISMSTSASNNTNIQPIKFNNTTALENIPRALVSTVLIGNIDDIPNPYIYYTNTVDTTQTFKTSSLTVEEQDSDNGVEDEETTIANVEDETDGNLLGIGNSRDEEENDDDNDDDNDETITESDGNANDDFFGDSDITKECFPFCD